MISSSVTVCVFDSTTTKRSFKSNSPLWGKSKLYHSKRKLSTTYPKSCKTRLQNHRHQKDMHSVDSHISYIKPLAIWRKNWLFRFFIWVEITSYPVIKSELIFYRQKDDGQKLSNFTLVARPSLNHVCDTSAVSRQSLGLSLWLPLNGLLPPRLHCFLSGAKI